MKTRSNFESKVYSSCILSNITCGILTVAYVMLLVNPSPFQVFAGFIFSVILTLADEFLISPFSTKIICKSLTKKIDRLNANGIKDYQERTELFEELMIFPVKRGFLTFSYFIISSVIMIFCTHFLSMFNFSVKICLLELFPCIAGSIAGSITSGFITEKICNPIAEKILNDKIDTSYVIKKKNFGLSLSFRIIIFLFIPFLTATILTFILLISSTQDVNGYKEKGSVIIIKVIIITLINIAYCLSSCILFYKHLAENNKKLQITLEEVLTTGEVKELPKTTIGDVIQYNTYIFNIIIKRFENLIKKASQIGKNIRETTDTLSSMANELSITSNTQNTNIKQLLSTMDESNAFTQDIASQISKVSSDTEITKENVSKGFEILSENINQMEEIKEANDEIIDGIQDLAAQVNGINNVITVIKDIADQTRIIAFNAEIEAVNAGQEGKNFHIVATEIRRLSNNTMNSIIEIQRYIETIKEASKNLIVYSENETLCIKEESNTVKDLENHFNSIKQSAIDTSSKSSEISTIVHQQATSFVQIIITLRQLGESIESFTSSTENISSIANQLQTIAIELENIKDKKLT